MFGVSNIAEAKGRLIKTYIAGKQQFSLRDRLVMLLLTRTMIYFIFRPRRTCNASGLFAPTKFRVHSVYVRS